MNHATGCSSECWGCDCWCHYRPRLTIKSIPLTDREWDLIAASIRAEIAYHQGLLDAINGREGVAIGEPRNNLRNLTSTMNEFKAILTKIREMGK